jgi:hypothetical protein
MTAGEGGDGTDGFQTGNNTTVGGSKGAQGPAAPAPEKPKAAAPPPPPPSPPAPAAPSIVDESALSVKPDIRCSPSRMAALYPQAAIDNDAEADVPVDCVVDATGRINNPKARVDPGFGLREASEKALMVACRPMAIPRDANGNLVSARVMFTVKWQLE